MPFYGFKMRYVIEWVTGCTCGCEPSIYLRARELGLEQRRSAPEGWLVCWMAAGQEGLRCLPTWWWWFPPVRPECWKSAGQTVPRLQNIWLDTASACLSMSCVTVSRAQQCLLPLPVVPSFCAFMRAHILVPGVSFGPGRFSLFLLFLPALSLAALSCPSPLSYSSDIFRLRPESAISPERHGIF